MLQKKISLQTIESCVADDADLSVRVAFDEKVALGAFDQVSQDFNEAFLSTDPEDDEGQYSA